MIVKISTEIDILDNGLLSLQIQLISLNLAECDFLNFKLIRYQIIQLNIDL